jgi:8-oxo-dGTP diphosphatase
MPIPPYLRDLRRHVGRAMLMVPSVSAVVRDEAGRMLLGLRSDTREWSLLAGIVDPGEQPADAIVRRSGRSQRRRYGSTAWRVSRCTR